LIPPSKLTAFDTKRQDQPGYESKLATLFLACTLPNNIEDVLYMVQISTRINYLATTKLNAVSAHKKPAK